MHIILPFSHKDMAQARRLVLWLQYIGGLGNYPLTLSVTKRAFATEEGQEVIALAQEYFGADVFVPHDENERGWPYSATHLFQRTLAHVNDDFFWLEADCVPMHAGWFDELVEAFDESGSTFVGCKVVMPDGVDTPTHMTGCAFYSKNWASVCPNLADDYNYGFGAWDVDFAGCMLTDFTHTDLIHHRWERINLKHRAQLSDVNPGTVLYHQCKTGSLMNQIEPQFFDWALTVLKEHSFIYTNMTRYFLTKNASKAVYAGGRQFLFEPVSYFTPTSSFWGVFTATTERDAVDLEAAAQTGAISQLSEAEFTSFVEKKKRTVASPVSSNSNVPKRQLGPDVIQQANVLVVEEASPKVPVEQPTAAVAETLNEALEVHALPPEKEVLPRRKATGKSRK